MPNRINDLMQSAIHPVLSIYFTAGFPTLNQTVETIEALQNAGVHLIEIGIPFSDPLADGPTIQESSTIALQNGMSLKLLMQQLQAIRQSVNIPLIFMGYLNPILQYGIKEFIEECAKIGIDGLIVPDLPLDLYLEQYQQLFKQNNLRYIPLITPSTSDDRIHWIDQHTNGFIYMVSSHATTGGKLSLQQQTAYFERMQNMKLRNPLIAGFGIQSRADINFVSRYCKGTIVGSAFIKNQKGGGDIATFVEALK